MKKRLLLLFILIILPVKVLAIEDVYFRSGGKEVEYVSMGLLNSVSIIVKLNEDFNQISVDLSSIVDTAPISIQQENCDVVSGDYLCSVRTGDIRITSQDIQIPITIENSTGTETITFTKTLLLDTTPPEVTSIQTDYCQEGKCYLSTGQGKLIFEVNEGESGMSRANIFVSALEDEKQKLTRCSEGWICNYYLNVPESTGDSFLVTIVPIGNTPSSDDAGNEIIGVTQERIYIDKQAPDIINHSIETSAGLDIIRTTDTIIVKAKVTEDSTTPSISLDLSNFGITNNVEGSCEPASDGWNCEVSARPGNERTRTDDIEIIISDIVGNEAKEIVEIKVFSVSGVAEPDNWKESTAKTGPQKISKDNLILNGRNFHALVTFNPIGNSEVINIEEKVSCEAAGAPGASSSNLRDVHVVDPTPGENTYYIKGTLINENYYEGYDYLNYTCYVSVLTKRGDEVESQIEEVPFYIEFDLQRTGRVDEVIKNKVNQSIQAYEANKKVIEQYDANIKKFVNICRSYSAFASASSAFAGGEATAATNENVPLITAFNIAATTSAKGSEMIGPICNFVTCKSTLTGIQQNAIDFGANLPGMDKFATAAGVENPNMVFDPYKSEFIAYATLCMPAIIKHKERRLLNECTYSSCLSRSMTLGMGSVNCDKTYAYNECLHNTGSVINAIPYSALVTTLGDKLEQITSDPFTFGATALVSILCMEKVANLLPTSEFGWIHSGCVIAGKAAEMAKVLPMVQSIMSDYTQPTVVSQCESSMQGIDMDQLLWQQKDNTRTLDNLEREYDINGEKMKCAPEGCRYKNMLIRYEIKSAEEPKAKPEQFKFYKDEGDGTFTEIEINNKNWEELNSIMSSTEQTSSTSDSGSSGSSSGTQTGQTSQDRDGNVEEIVTSASYSVSQQTTPSTESQDSYTISYQNGEFEDADGKLTGQEIINHYFALNPDNPDKAYEAAKSDGIDLGKLTNNRARVVQEATSPIQEPKEVVIDTNVQQNLAAETLEEADISKDNPEEVEDFKDGQIKAAQDALKNYNALGSTYTAFISAQNELDIAKTDYNTALAEYDKGVNELNALKTRRDNAEGLSETEIDALNEEISAKETAVYGEGLLKRWNKEDDNLAGKVNKKKSELKTKEKALKDKNRRLMTEQLYPQLWGGLNTWQSFLNIGQSLSFLTSFIIDKEKETWTTPLNNIITNLVSHPEKSICNNDLPILKKLSKLSSTSDDSGVVTFTSSAGETPGAFLYGSKSEELPDGSREYFVGVLVENPKKDGLKFEIELEGPGQYTFRLDDEGRVIEELPKNGVFERRGDNLLHVTLGQDYEQVCIKFSHDDNELRQYFDTVSLDNEKLCQRLSVE